MVYIGQMLKALQGNEVVILAAGSLLDRITGSKLLPQFLSDTGQKKTADKKDGRRMSFQKPKGTIEYSVSCCLIIRMSLQA